MDYKQGDLFNERYVLLSPLGNGSFGELWLSFDIIDKSKRTLKFVGDEYLDHQSIVNECQILKKIYDLDPQNRQKTNIVECFGFSSKSGSIGQNCIVLEYLEGDTLDQYISRHHPSLYERIDILLGVLSGLELLEQQKVIHRDIKANNIFITNDKRIKIIDFGLAFKVDEPTSTNKFIKGGAPFFSDPFATGEHDLLSDIYSFGYLFYFLLMNKDPVYNYNYSIKDHYRDFEQSNLLDDIFFKCTDQDRSKRFHSFTEISDALISAYEKINAKKFRYNFNFSDHVFESIDELYQKINEEFSGNYKYVLDIEAGQRLDGLIINNKTRYSFSNDTPYILFRFDDQLWGINGDTHISTLIQFLQNCDEKRDEINEIKGEEVFITENNGTALRLISLFDYRTGLHRANGFYCYLQS